MSYTFTAKPGTTVTIPVEADLTGFTLKLILDKGGASAPVEVTSGLVAGNRQVALDIPSGTSIFSRRRTGYRLVGNKAGKDSTLQEGMIYGQSTANDDNIEVTVLPNPTGDLIKTVQEKYRDDFAGTALNSDFWTVTTGPGMTVAVTNSELRVDTGTTANAVTTIRSRKAWSGAYRVMFLAGATLLSQRIANQTFELRVVNAAGNSYAGWVLTGTTATTGIARAYNNGTTSGDQTQAGIPTTAGPIALEIENFIDEVYYHSRAPESTNARTTTNVKNRQTPDPNEDMFIEIRVTNGATAPASTTRLTLDAVLVQDISELTTEITGGRGGGGASQAVPVAVIGGTNVNAVSPGTAAGQLGKAEDAAHATGDVGVAVWGVRAGTTPSAPTSAVGDYSQILVDAEGKLITAASSADPANTVQAVTDLTLTTNVAIIAAGAAGIRNYVTDLTFDNTGAAAARVVVDDGTTRVFTATVPAGTTFTKVFDTPLRGTAATAVNARLAAAGTVTVSAQGFRGI